MPKPIKQIIVDAIIKEVENGTDRGKVIAKYCKKFQKSARTIDTYWKVANEQHVVKRNKIDKALAIVDTNAAIEARKKAIMSAEDRMEWLTKMIMGETETPKIIVINAEVTEHPEKPNHADRLRALSELNKMMGDYAPSKIAQTNIKGEDVEQTIIVWGGKKISV